MITNHVKNNLLLSLGVMVVLAILPMLAYAQSSEEDVFKKNHISLMVSDLTVARVSVDYERIIDEKGHLALHVPLIWVVRDYFAILSSNHQKYSVGLGLNIYPTAQGKFKYFLGPELRYGLFDSYCYINEDTNQSVVITPREKCQKHKIRFLVNNGVVFTPVPQFSVAAVLGLGLESYLCNKDTKNSSRAWSTSTFSVRLGYRF